MVEFSDEQRRTRMARRHALAPGAAVDSMAAVARALVAIHATDPASVFISTWARVPGITRPEIEASLYDERTVVRVMGMRRTLFVVPAETFPLVDVGVARDLAARERRRLLKLIAEGELASDPERWLARIEAATMAALADRGEASTAELSAAVPELKTPVTMGAGKWAADVPLSGRVMFLLATGGHIVRTRPRGTWLSSQWRWTPTDRWLGARPDPDTDQARAEIVRSYLGRFGPATETDLVWWTGWTKTATRAAIAQVEPDEVGVEGGRGYVLPGDLTDIEPVEPWIALLPSLDATIMGWKERDWYLGPHGAEVFDNIGNAGPVVVADGRVVGGWAQATDGSVVFETLEPVTAAVTEAVSHRAAELGEWLGGRVVMPRFASPLHRRLAAG